VEDNIFKLRYEDLQIRFSLEDESDFARATDAVELAEKYNSASENPSKEQQEVTEAEGRAKDVARIKLVRKFHEHYRETASTPDDWQPIFVEVATELRQEGQLEDVNIITDDPTWVAMNTLSVRKNIELKAEKEELEDAISELVGEDFEEIDLDSLNSLQNSSENTSGETSEDEEKSVRETSSTDHICDDCGREFQSEYALYGHESGGCTADRSRKSMEYSGEERKEAIRDGLSNSDTSLTVSEVAKEIYGEEIQWDDLRYSRVSKVLSEMDDIEKVGKRSHSYLYALSDTDSQISDSAEEPQDLSREREKELVQYHLEQSESAKTVQSLCEEIYGQKFESSEHPDYQRIYRALNDLDDVEEAGKIGMKKQYYIPSSSETDSGITPYKNQIVNQIGENEYQIRIHALNKLIPEQAGESTKVTYSDFRGVYAGEHETNPKKVWRWFCTNDSFHKAFQYETETDLKFSLEKESDTQSLDPMKQFTLKIERTSDDQ